MFTKTRLLFWVLLFSYVAVCQFSRAAIHSAWGAGGRGSLNRTALPPGPGACGPGSRVGAGSPEASLRVLTGAVPRGVCVLTSSSKDDTSHIGQGHPTELILA